MLQSHQPERPVFRALLSGDQERFYAAEIAAREAAGLPPFGRLASLLVSAKERSAAEAHARRLAQAGHALCRRRSIPGSGFSDLPIPPSRCCGKAPGSADPESAAQCAARP